MGGTQGFTGSPTAGTPLARAPATAHPPPCAHPLSRSRRVARLAARAQRLGAVYQRVQPNTRVVDHIVEVSLPPPLPLPGAPTLRGSATLSHSLAETAPSTIRITFEKITFRPQGVRGLRGLSLPSPLRALGDALPEALQGGSFDTTYADGDLRVSRGDRGELRVFVRA